jgi:hypothetical protein
MKNLYLASLLAFLPVAAIAQTNYGMMDAQANFIFANNKLNLEDSTSYYYSSSNPRYFDSLFYRYSYDNARSFDGQGQLTVLDTQSFTGNKIHTSVTWTKQGSTFTPSIYSRFSYTPTGKIFTYTYFYSIGSGDSIRSVYQYDVADKLTEVQTLQWTTISPGWTPMNRISYTYTGSNVATELRQQWLGASWVDDSRTTYTYNTAGEKTNTLGENSNGGNWVNSFRVAYTYTGGRLTTAVDDFWNLSAWEPGQKQTYTYDTKGNMLTETTEMWQNNAWQPQRQNTWQYKPILIIEQTLSWNSQTSKYELMPFDREIHRHFPPLASIGDSKSMEANNLHIYPVPAQNKLYIDIKSAGNEPALLHLCGMDGKVVQQTILQPGISSHTVDVSAIPAGNYILKVSGSRAQTQLITIAK